MKQSKRRGSESSTLETDVYVWRYTLLVVHARYEEDVQAIRSISSLVWVQRVCFSPSYHRHLVETRSHCYVISLALRRVCF